MGCQGDWMTEPATRRSVPAAVRLAVFGALVCLTHHLGLLTDPLGGLGPTRINDWLDLLTPYAVVGSALWVLLAERPAGQAGDAAHLWDEVVSHHLWYAGLTILVIALARALRDAPLRITWLGWALAVGVGVTYATNAIGGGTAPASLLATLGLVIWGVRRPDATGRLLLVTYGFGAVVLIGYGIRYGGWSYDG